ncbi:MAG TPA: DUF393 domain-containing protein, partial [Aggregatilineaceae bacterium]|nr:DUF393 domain-containing protein [Aggregatilineaceae bacterium]
MSGLVVVYDGDCGICDKLRQMAVKRDRKQRLKFVPFQAADLNAISPGLTVEMTSRALYAVRQDGKRWHGAQAVFMSMRELPGVWKVIGAVGSLKPVSLIAEPFYRVVA